MIRVVHINPIIWPPWIIVAYLIIPELEHLIERLSAPEGKFYDVVNQYLQAFLNEGKMPPDTIAPAILNLADDYMAGRQMTLKAGDYIAIQNHIREIG